MTAKTKHKLGIVLVVISTVVNLLNIALKNQGVSIPKLFGLPLFFIGLLLVLSSRAKTDKETTQDS